MKLATNLGIHLGDDPLVIGQLDLELTAHLYHPSGLAFQLALHIDQITGSQIELVIVVRKRHVAGREPDVHQTFHPAGFLCFLCFDLLQLQRCGTLSTKLGRDPHGHCLLIISLAFLTT